MADIARYPGDQSHLPPRQRKATAQAVLAVHAPEWADDLQDHLRQLYQMAQQSLSRPACQECGWPGGMATVAILGKLVDAKSKLVTSSAVAQAPPPPPTLDLSKYPAEIRQALVDALTAADAWERAQGDNDGT